MPPSKGPRTKLGYDTKRGLNWFSKQNRLSFAQIISQNFDKSILNQSPFTQHPLLKFFLSKKNIFLTFSKLIETKMRKKDKIKRRNTSLFIPVHSLSLEKLIQLSNSNPN